MNKVFWLVSAAVIGASGWSVEGAVSRSSQSPADTILLHLARSQFQAIRRAPETRDSVLVARQALGRRLFFDPRWSLDGKVSCVTCHPTSHYGADTGATSVGVLGRRTPRNAPTVLNAALQFAQHWRGDRRDLEDQALKALTGPQSGGHASLDDAERRLRALRDYETQFAAAFPRDTPTVSGRHFADAVAAYERTLLTPSRFDAYLDGDATALSAAELAGLRRFLDIGCSACHNGVGVGGGSFQRFGVVENYWVATRSTHVDSGRFDVTHVDADRYVFKVPSLRNAAETGPYFHDGSVATLEEAIRVMARVQLHRRLEDADVHSIATFLRTLTGGLPSSFAQPPPALGATR